MFAGQGYPHSASGIGGYSPMKIDLGGVVLGAIIGIGALLIVPKVVSAFNGGYGGYGGNYRSKPIAHAKCAKIVIHLFVNV